MAITSIPSTVSSPATATTLGATPMAITGLSSGLDTTSIIQKLISLEQGPVNTMKKKQTNLADQLGAWQTFNTNLLTLNTAMKKLNTDQSFRGSNGTFTNSVTGGANVVGLTTIGSAGSGTYSFSVNNMAQQQKMISTAGYASPTADAQITSMTISFLSKGATIQGQTPVGPDAANPGTPAISQTFTQTNLQDLAVAVNSSSLEITASIVNSGSDTAPSYRLMLISNNTGANEAFSVSTVAGENGVGPNPNPLNFTVSQAAQNASVTLDGLTVSRSSNTINDLLPGMSLGLTGTGSGQIALGSDNASIVKNVQDFATAYNTAMDFARAQTTYKPGETNPPLFGNSTLLSISQSLSGIVSAPVGGLPANNGYSSLSQVGVTTDANNHLTVDTAQLTKALSANATGVRRLFTPNGQGTYTYVRATGATTSAIYDTQVVRDASGNPVMQMRRQGTSEWITMTQSGVAFDGPAGSSLDGFTMEANNINVGDTGTMNISVGIAESVAYRTRYYTELSSQGAVYNEEQSITKRSTDYQTQIDDQNQRITKKTSVLTARFAKLESVLATLKSQGSYLTSQLASLPTSMGK